MKHLGKDTLHFYVATSHLPNKELRDATRWQAFSKQVTTITVLLCNDLVAIALSFFMATGLRLWLDVILNQTSVPHAYSFATLGYMLLVWPALLWREGLYPGYGLTAPQQLRKQVTACFYAGTLFATTTVFFYRDLPVPRGVLLLMVLLTMVLLPPMRSLSKRLLLYFKAWGSQVVVLGAGEAGQRVVKALKLNPLEGLHPVALFDDDPQKISKEVEGVRVVGPLENADYFAKTHNIRHVIVAIPSMSSRSLLSIIKARGKTFTSVQFVPELGALSAEDVRTVNLDGLLALEVRSGLYSRRKKFSKRLLDLLGSTLGGIAVSPLFLFLYVWVRLDSRGPGFYWSERVGQNGSVFQCLKFRTMYTDAEKRLEELIASDHKNKEEYEKYHKLHDDPRITRAGRVLRKLSLDELPQLYNVFRGDMSLVGPRPYLTREYPDMNGYAETILEAKPGITGYWQITGRNNVTFQDRLQMESHYVRSWSIWWDIVILFQTVSTVLKREGAK